MPRTTQVLKAFNDLALGWKIALACAVLLGVGSSARDYVALPTRMATVEAHMTKVEVVHDSLGGRFDRMEKKIDQTQCLIIKNIQRQDPWSCLKETR